MKKIKNTAIGPGTWERTEHSKIVLMSTITILFFAALSCAGFTSGIKQSYKMSNTSFDVVDSTGLAKVEKVAIANGTSLVLNKKAKKLEPAVLECTEKFEGYLLEELGKKEINAVPGKTETIGAVDLIDPFRIVSRKEAKVLTGRKPDHAEMSVELREWEECEGCESLARSVGADALWVVWARWFKVHEDQSKTEYCNKEKGWLHVSAELFSVKEGKLLAWTAINRTGMGIGPLVKSSPAYSAIAKGMAKNLAKHRSGE
jgi:hypothetical protein